jgi:homoserine kinase
MSDRIHQPYRAPVCPLLPLLAPLVGADGILGIALSGAGPAVLVVVDSEASVGGAHKKIKSLTEASLLAEVVACRFSSAGAGESIEKKGFSLRSEQG